VLLCELIACFLEDIPAPVALHLTVCAVCFLEACFTNTVFIGPFVPDMGQLHFDQLQLSYN